MPDDTARRRRRFEAVFAEVYEPLQRYVRRRVPAAAADDVVADALLVVWRRLDDIPPDAVVPWCFGVARHCLANQRRSARRADRLARKVAATTPTAPGDGGLAPAGADPALAAALASISADDREVVRLWAWEQLSPAEIATALDITPNAASIRLHRAKRRLADRLAARKDEPPPGQTSNEHGEEGWR